MRTPLYIALRYLFSKKSTNVINVISGISVIGVMVATVALVVVLSVFNGFSDLLWRPAGYGVYQGRGRLLYSADAY